MCKNRGNAYILTGLAPKFMFTSYRVESNLIYQRYMEFLQVWLPMLSDNKTASAIPILYHPCAVKCIYNGS